MAEDKHHMSGHRFYLLHNCLTSLLLLDVHWGSKEKILYSSASDPYKWVEKEFPHAFHVIIGCDTTSPFAGIGKQSAWRTFATFARLLEHLGEDQYLSGDVLSNAEAFVCQLCNLGTREALINIERAATFRREKKSLDGLPPTEDALNQPFIWKKASEPCPVLHSREGNGWHPKEGVRKSTLVTMPQVSAWCVQLAYCGCTPKGCLLYTSPSPRDA